MIQVILLILKIIGITILVLLGLILLVLALVLFVPVFYRVRVIHNPSQTKVTARVSFLFPLLLITIQYLKKLSYKVRVFGIAALNSEKPKKEKKEKNKKEKQKVEKLKKKNVAEKVPETKKEEVWAPLEPKKLVKVPESHAEAEQTSAGQSEEKQKQGFFERIRCKIRKIRETISNIINKIKKLLHQKDEVLRILAKEETKQAFSFAWDKLKSLLKHVLPRKIKGYVAYGADNPATTGQVLGVLSVVYARTGQLLEIRPNFTEKQLECDLFIKGRIQVFSLLVIAIKVFLNKELRQLVSEFKNIKEIE